MAFDYSEVIATARELVAEFGRVVDFEKLSTLAADDTQPWRGVNLLVPTVEATQSLAACFVPPSGTGFGKDVITDSMIKAAEQVALVASVAAPTFDPELANSVQDGGVRWRIVWQYVLKPGPLVALYAFGLAR